MEAIVSFIESNPGISFLNLQLFFGAEIKGSGITEDQINAACRDLRPAGSVQLGKPDEADDYVVNIPLSVFDTATDINEKHVKEICDKIAALTTPIEIVLNEQVPNHAAFLDVPLEDFDISTLSAAYDSIKTTKDTVSKVREMLFDFQPQLLERESHHILKKMSVGGVSIFASISDFINAFSEKKFFDVYQAMRGEKPPLVQMVAHGYVWVGSFGNLSLRVHVLDGRQGTGAGNKINAGNVIQAALFYKDRKNDFIRSNSAISMIQHCSTEWPVGRSLKDGTTYTFSDLYTGEKIVQKYDGKLPDFASPFPFVSILENYHVASKAKPIFTNQEHLVAVYPASCIFRDDCYYETLVANLQMISQKANSDVNLKIYEDPFGKVKYVRDIHEKHKKDFVGKLFFKQIQLCKTAMLLTKSDELELTYRDLMQTLTDKEGELKLVEYQLKQERNNVSIRLGRGTEAIADVPGGVKIKPATLLELTDTDKKELLVKHTDLNEELDAIQMHFAQFGYAKTYPFDPAQKKEHPGYAAAKKQFVELHSEMEYKTRKAILMGRLDKMQRCCLEPGNEKTIEYRRSVVLSCIDSVAIIVSCAKIGVLTQTTTASAHQQLVKDSKELAYLRTLSTKLFHDYNSDKERYAAVSGRTIRIITLQQQLMEIIQKQIIQSCVTGASLDLSEAMRRRGNIDNDVLKSVIAELQKDPTKAHDMENLKYKEQRKRLREINLLDAEITRLTDTKNKLNGDIAYVLTHLSEIGSRLEIDLLDLAHQVNTETLGLLNLLGRDETPEFKDCMALLARQETRYAPVAAGMVDIQNREDVFDDVGIGKTVELVSELCPQEEGTNIAVANAIASDILNGQGASTLLESQVNDKWLLLKQKADEVLSKRKRLSVDLHRMIAGLEIEQIQAKIGHRTRLLERITLAQGPASESPQFTRWMRRLQNEDKLRKTLVQEKVTESDGIRSFMYFYICNNPQSKPSPEMVRQIVSYINNDQYRADRAKNLPELKSLLVKPRYPTGPRASVRGGMVGGVDPYEKEMNAAEIEKEMNDAIDKNDIVKMYDLYIEYFDKETDLNLLFYQVYSILSKQSIYVPLYRRYVTPLEEMIGPVLAKRIDYTGDLHDFDCVYADNFCVQIFGKNANELLHDLSKGKLTVPRGVFPNICENPFNPYSLICILEVCRFFCLFLPFAGRLHFYFAGVLSFMGQNYDRNMVEIQTDEIISLLEHGDFFDAFHKAARMYNGSETEKPPPFVTEASVTPLPPIPALDTVPALESVPASLDTVPASLDTVPSSLDTVPGSLETVPAPLESVPAPLETVPGSTLPASLGASLSPEPLFGIPSPDAAGPDTAAGPYPTGADTAAGPYPTGADAAAGPYPSESPEKPDTGKFGGTRRYRRYKSKTKRQTLNKRFKKHRTRRLHGLYVRD